VLSPATEGSVASRRLIQSIGSKIQTHPLLFHKLGGRVFLFFRILAKLPIWQRRIIMYVGSAEKGQM